MPTSLLLLTAALAHAQPTDCATARIGEITNTPAPAVLVLGERKGTQPDLMRAERIVSRLAARGPVTLALEAVHRDAQPLLDRYAESRMSPADLPELIGWGSYWGFAWAPYQRLVTAADMGAEVVGVGIEPIPRPQGASLALPPGYLRVLTDAMGDHPVPVELEPDFIEMVAWRDYSMARQAIDAWDGEGWLIVLADRLHVQGGQGVGWQLARLTEAPVYTYLLADGGTRCYADDTVIFGFFEALFR